MDKIKQIWALLRKAIWPMAKPFICLEKFEAQEIAEAIEKSMEAAQDSRVKARGLEDVIPSVPSAYGRIKKALEDD